ncbi:MAG: hypothetical protein U0271_02130 [Polyangiaceae bacterium]
MPFKSISQPRRVASMQGEARGASFNRKLGAIAIVSNNPSEVAIVGQSGSPARTFGVSLDETSDIALLSRDMAIVRTTDEVWQLLDIAHKAKIDPLTKDVRSLVGPQGEASLALKWDNSGEVLTPGRNEVASRSFTLRGDHRCVDVGENECYAVVEGGDGEFRIHPGGTPEQGSTTRTALPGGTKNLDRLKGGRFLSVVYQRGNPTVCLVRRAGNRLDTKLVTLDIPCTDVAVAETSLIAIARDGRAVLYDSEAIDKATSRMDPKSETHLGCDGEPRCMVVAGGNLFVGTHSGEIMMAVIVRKQGMG